jgi:rod shape determining protein RodA
MGLLNWINRFFFTRYTNPSSSRYSHNRSWLQRIHVDPILLLGLASLTIFGFIILYSASNQNFHQVKSQAAHIAVASLVMLLLAQIPPHTYKRWAPIIYTVSLILLAAVLVTGHINKGAQRWLGVGGVRFQPSEMMKLGIPLILSYVLSKKPLPPNFNLIAVCLGLIAFPAVLTTIQPDLGTGILLFGAGISALFLAGVAWRYLGIGSLVALITAPAFWFFMHDYQRQRVLTFLDPERDPLGSGYHIIQSKIAIGSGGLFGKGWLNGTQSHLRFLPEHTTDFIFAVCGEEFGLLGSVMLIVLYMFVILRGFYITINAQDTFSRILAGSLTLMFFLSLFINIGMVSGILPVVGVPLPLISYGGSSVVTLMASFGILMSIQTHRKLLSS